jgi:riboflavin biosynthesis pyrimidine reductase
MKPYLICHMCTTIDGKILSNRWGKVPGQSQSGSAGLFETTAASFRIGAWVVGTTTMKEFQGRPQRLPKAARSLPRTDFVAKPRAKRLAIGADAKGLLRFQEDQVDGDHVVLLVTERVTSDYLAHLRQAGVSYLFCGEREVSPATALRKLAAAFKLRKLMLQGGGTFNGSFLRAGLVDEISQLIVPIADGGGAEVTGFFDLPENESPPAKAAALLKLTSTRKLPGGVIWLRYRVVGKTKS